MRALLTNIWLLSLSIFCFIPWVWLGARRDQMMATSEIEAALAYVGFALSVLSGLSYTIFTLRRTSFVGWAFPASFGEEVGKDARPGAGARQLLRIGVTVGALVGVAALPVSTLLLSWDQTLGAGSFEARRMAIHESRSLRLNIPRLLRDAPAGSGPVALAVQVGESDYQDLLESEILAYELYPRRTERLWLKDCEAGLDGQSAAQLDAIIYQCDRGDAYSWRDPGAPIPDYWPGFSRQVEAQR
ncbi:MAG: hypothetical protein KDH09_14490 [Chrysiogenetes bacterium]|nr:hypothetical protein [Chrysiogenetes bacterium]